MSGDPTVPPLLVATRNHGKLVELRPMFAAAGLRVIDLDEAGILPSADEDAVEVHATFEENALAKARYYGGRAGCAAVADDSGLEVAALGGRPGVRSRRYAGVVGPTAAVDAANNARLVAELADAEDRSARFVCAAAYWAPEGREVVRRGTVEGRILESPEGQGGFGYDPLFWSEELGATFGSASRERKAEVSHRARAFAALLAALNATGSAAAGR